MAMLGDCGIQEPKHLGQVSQIDLPALLAGWKQRLSKRGPSPMASRKRHLIECFSEDEKDFDALSCAPDFN